MSDTTDMPEETCFHCGLEIKLHPTAGRWYHPTLSSVFCHDPSGFPGPPAAPASAAGR